MSLKHRPTDAMMKPSQDAGGTLDLFTSRMPPSTQGIPESLARDVRIRGPVLRQAE